MSMYFFALPWFAAIPVPSSGLWITVPNWENVECVSGSIWTLRGGEDIEGVISGVWSSGGVNESGILEEGELIYIERSPHSKSGLSIRAPYNLNT